ncbi:MAG TPA: N-acetyl-gamma-glutamyl-phosphate reductase, partial [Bacteroidales bacterium]|nr:N-acetyl-gamma-glutamyl-phosphate reductase [Bacteroidales bacterium]
HMHAITGATGAGALPSDTTHYAWRSNNVSVYKVFNHQHVPEVEALLSSVAGNRLPSLFFVPMRGGFSRGIFAGVYTECPLTQEEATELYLEYYSRHPFVSVAKESISLKEVVNTNKCKLYMEKHGNMLYTTSILDNLLKGASGTAVQNMNLLTGLPQTTGLNLKATAF